MAKSNNPYIQFYTPGSVACKVELQQEREWAPLPKFRPAKQVVIAVDPVAILGVLVAVCMLVCMAVGIRQLNQTRREVAALENYVAQLTAQKQTLTQQYTDSYDLNTVKQQALDMGLIPASEAKQTQIHVVPAEQPVGAASLWNRISTVVTGLFA